MLNSIIQKDNTRCFICGGREERLDCHHVFNASNRKKSEKYGLVVYLCHNKCHLYGVHQKADMMQELKAKAQAVAMEYYGWSTDDFREIFGKSYL